MKVQLTERRTVEAEGKWFKVKVTDLRVTVAAPGVGTVYVRRTREGLEVSLQPEGVAGFMEIATAQGDSLERRQFTNGSFTAKVRGFGSVTLGEMDDPELRAATEVWMKRPKK
jgi:hypothetical protein